MKKSPLPSVKPPVRLHKWSFNEETALVVFVGLALMDPKYGITSTTPSGQHFVQVIFSGQMLQGTSKQALAQVCFLPVSAPKSQYQNCDSSVQLCKMRWMIYISLVCKIFEKASGTGMRCFVCDMLDNVYSVLNISYYFHVSLKFFRS